jgi:hypothetical protein
VLVHGGLHGKELQDIRPSDAASNPKQYRHRVRTTYQ